MIGLAELDVMDPSAPLPRARGEVWFLARAGAEVLGEARVPRYTPLMGPAIRTFLLDRYRSRLYGLDALSVKSELDPLSPSDVTIVVPTRRRPRLLSRCLRSLGALHPKPAACVVVDGAGGDAATSEIAAEHGARVVRSRGPGACHNRNQGLRTAETEVVAFVDDDTVLDAGFVAAVGRAFASPEVTAVAGLIRPAELETYPQIAFERLLGGHGKGFRRRLYHRDIEPIDPAELLGVGPNLAFRRDALLAIDGFDEGLGPGTVLEAGDDLDVLDRVLREGAVVAYEPSQLLAHVHPRTRSELLRRVRHRAAALRRFAAIRHRDPRSPGYALGSSSVGSRMAAAPSLTRRGRAFGAQIALQQVAGALWARVSE